MINALLTLHDRLDELAADPGTSEYKVPSLWIQPDDPGQERVRAVEPLSFYRDVIAEILATQDHSPDMLSSSGEWTASAVVYNIFTRLTTAWDHNGDGSIDLGDLEGGWRETGTFLKTIAILPYLQRMGVNTLHFLPITAIGQDGNKGSLGSPYAIRNPYKLDERLCEPVHGLGVEQEFAAFVEAAHKLGIRVVLEFVFRTASKDSEWIADHPNWFYWIDNDIPDRDNTEEHEDGYGNPCFSEEELHVINLRVKRNDTSSLPPPSMAYRSMFKDMPLEITKEGDRYIGLLEDGMRVRIPGAFADWPPDDVQPPWNDVTYLKMYDHPSFDYIAYNTIRIYDSRLATVENENRGLWNTVINIVPHYQKNFNIDGVMIDMGHALPRRLKQSIVDRSRKMNPDFAFWEENFAISSRSRQEGYNATVGYLWCDQHIPEKLKGFCQMLATHDVPVPFFATPETHNTPRAASRPGGTVFSRMAFAVNSFLPAVLFIHQGYELGETFPVNTGLGFKPEDIENLPSHSLPLFSESALCWNNDGEFTSFIHDVMTIREEWKDLVVIPSGRTFREVEVREHRVLGFERISFDKDRAVTVIANTDCHQEVETDFVVEHAAGPLTDALTGTVVESQNGNFHTRLAPGQVMIFPMRIPVEGDEAMPVEDYDPGQSGSPEEGGV